MHEAASQRALRKQLLLTRAASQRAEMAQALLAARQSLTFSAGGVTGLVLAKGMPLALGLLKRAPLLSPLLSLALAGARRPLARYTMLGAGSALLAWRGFQWFARRKEAPADAGLPPV
jgi:hypothetical protein